jgi:iron complex outermembrane recepter protein
VDTLETVIVSVTPVMGTGIPLNQVPSNVQTLRASQIQEDHAQTLSDAMNRHFASTVIADTEGNPFQQDLVSRGFTASPVLGTPQGIAIYQNGARINEAFGDIVLWDLIPLFAIEQLQELPGSNPVFGLNALGGAVTLQMKDGFDFQGNSLEAAEGSFGRYRETAQWGTAADGVGSYVGVQASHDGGWRQLSASDVVQSFADLSVHGSDYQLGTSVTLAWSHLNGNGADPAQDDPTAAFAVPDLELDHLVFLQAHGDRSFTDHWSLHGTAYMRYVDIEIQNGAASGFTPCGTTVCDASGPLELLDGAPLSQTLPYAGIIPEQTTRTTGLGGSLQLTVDQPLGARDNVANVGVTFDQGLTHFTNVTWLGSLEYLSPPGTTTLSDGLLVGGSAYNVRLDATNRYYGLFLTDTLSITAALAATASARINEAEIDLDDLFGNALNGDHSFSRVNPSAGLTYQLTRTVTGYASYSEANRIPTAAEFSCANPLAPCTFPLGFVSDPSLKQVVARTVEAGARGRVADLGPSGPSFDWVADVYDTRNANDIIFVSSGPLIASGYFRNSGDTERRGAETALEGTWGVYDFRASYGFVRATFQSHLTISSDNNPAADANGNIEVQPGDRLPEVPLQTARLALGMRLPHGVRIELSALAQSSQYLRGDEANLQTPLPGFAIFNASASWHATQRLTLYVEGENLLDRHYASFGLYGDPTGNGAFPQFTNPRFYVPGQPFGFWAGLQMRL